MFEDIVDIIILLLGENAWWF